MRDTIEPIAGGVDLQLEPQLPIRQVQIQYDREAAAGYGLTMAQLSNVVETALNGRVVSQVPEDQQLIDITVSLPESARNSLDAWIPLVQFLFPPRRESSLLWVRWPRWATAWEPT